MRVRPSTVKAALPFVRLVHRRLPKIPGLSVLSLADAPEQLRQWKRWWDSAVNATGVDWATFWSGQGGRWLLMFTAVAVVLWAWDVPSRLGRRTKRNPLVNSSSPTFQPVGPPGERTMKNQILSHPQEIPSE